MGNLLIFDHITKKGKMKTFVNDFGTVNELPNDEEELRKIIEKQADLLKRVIHSGALTSEQYEELEGEICELLKQPFYSWNKH